MSITVLSPGLMTTVQDLGRIGYQRFGVSVSGAVDPWATTLANVLVGNEDGEAVLECTRMGPQLRFDAANVIAITGGDLGATIDGRPAPLYQAVSVAAGSILRFSAPRSGCRSFIAFAGGLDIEPVMGSRSTYMKGKIGGFKGRKLEKGDAIGFRSPSESLPNMHKRAIIPGHTPGKAYTIRVIMGPQDDAFTQKGIDAFLGSEYEVSLEFDRMGCRLEGEVIEHKTSGDIISDGISFGAIQVPSAGKPIIMLSDRQTTGGYTKIANVISVDFPILAQLKARDRIRFQKVSVHAAQDALLVQRAVLDKLKTFINAN